MTVWSHCLHDTENNSHQTSVQHSGPCCPCSFIFYLLSNSVLQPHRPFWVPQTRHDAVPGPRSHSTRFPLSGTLPAASPPSLPPASFYPLELGLNITSSRRLSLVKGCIYYDTMYTKFKTHKQFYVSFLNTYAV